VNQTEALYTAIDALLAQADDKRAKEAVEILLRIVPLFDPDSAAWTSVSQ
jgi:hypothetical protein